MAWAHNTSNVSNCDIWYETFGDATKPALLLINGLGSQSINYQDAWCEKFADEEFFVLRFDNRDIGLSTSFEDAPLGPDGNAYLVSDMANDAIAVLDAEEIAWAHIMGLSMGGMIAQVLAIEHSDRLRSMTSIMSSSGEPGWGKPTDRALALLIAPPATDRESFIRAHIDGLSEWGSPEFADESRWTADAERAFDRSFRPTGSGRQFTAIRASPPRAERLPFVTVPTLVIHGDMDTLIDQSGGRRVAELIPDARFELIDGMGHDYPPQLWDTWVGLVTSFCRAVDAD